MIGALEAEGLKVYAPRARTFLDVDEAAFMLGLFMHVFGKPKDNGQHGRDVKRFHEWVDLAYKSAGSLLSSDSSLARYVKARRYEIAEVVRDYRALVETAEAAGWDLKQPYNPDHMKTKLVGVPGLSRRARKSLVSSYVERLIRRRIAFGRPFSLRYVILRATSLDWNALDLFYRLCGFRHFRQMFDQAENVRKDEGPVCNLSLLSQYLARFMDKFTVSVLSAELLNEDKFVRVFFTSYLYALFRRGETEYEDSEDPFPRGRIPFLTVHQAKGLEFPVVVLGNPRKTLRPQRVEEIVSPFLKRAGEPLERMAEFDVMRMFYVALSRAMNLLVIAHYTGRGQSVNDPFSSMLATEFPRIRDLDVNSLPRAHHKSDELPKTYSYTSDYLLYKRCPRQYMAFKKYGFVESRSQTMLFGSLVHQTIDDIHQRLIALRDDHEQTTTP
jgi:DNA helicase-2/ATP-dependent DNA helicase PcrA